MSTAPELVHPLPPEDLSDWVRAMASTFLQDPHSDHTTRRIDLLARDWDRGRAWGFKAGDRFVATLRTESRSLTVPGLDTDTNELAVDALTNVTVAATHRRRGLLTAMMRHSLDAAHGRGDAVSVLIAAEWPIYGRFGYAPATLMADYTLRRSRAGATVAGEPSCVRHVDRDEFAVLAPAIYERARRLRPGQLDRDARWWNRVLGQDGYRPSPDLPHNWLVHESDQGPDGLLAWQETSGHFGLIPPYGSIDVWDLVCAGDDAYRSLWAYLAGIDVVDELRFHNRPVDEPVRWLLHDARTLVMTEHVDMVWLRILDVPKALAARGYATTDELVLEVTDEALPSLVGGRYRLCSDAAAGTAACDRTRGDPDLTITQTALARMYLGGYRLRQLAQDAALEHTPGALRRVDLMFTTPLPPWNGTWF